MITIYSKKRKTKDGKNFLQYLTKLEVKSGETITVGVKFKTDIPKNFPVNIEVDRKTANMSPRRYTRSDGTEATSVTLWIDKWTPADVEFSDHSLDEVIL